MLISPSKNFIFIHIYKTGGSSVTDSFVKYSRLIDRLVYEYRLSRILIGLYVRIFKLSDNGLRQLTGYHKHATAASIIEGMKGGVKQFKQYYSFAFSRNPYTHTYSVYSYIKKYSHHPLYPKYHDLSFDQFVVEYLKSKPLRQIDFVCYENEIIVDFIGKTENLLNDVKSIQNILGLPTSKVGFLNKTNSRKEKDIMDNYNSVTKQLVSDYFSKDFEFFNYSV